MSKIGKPSSKTKTYYALHILQRWADCFKWTADECPLDHLQTLEAARQKGELLQRMHPKNVLAWCVVKEVCVFTTYRKLVAGMTRKRDRDRAFAASKKLLPNLRQAEQDRLRERAYKIFTPEI